ncbi:tail protein [Bacillus phage SP-10]|uniref:tail protein n=1 Tax=Bacillus phage SP10 TaxID=941058 RepID=UPI0002198B77|nr:tail protein [Bacillus phage SP-10]BAK52975.1 tail fiber protein [Bacillus phage SP-10]
MPQLKLRYNGRWVTIGGGLSGGDTGEIVDYIDQIKKELQNNLEKISTDLNNTDIYIDGAFRDGIITETEAKKIKAYLNTLNTSKVQLDQRFEEIYKNIYLPAFNKEGLVSANNTYQTAYENLHKTILDAIVDGKATEEESNAVDTAFDVYTRALSLLVSALEVSVDAINNAKNKETLDNSKKYTDDLYVPLDERVVKAESEIKTTKEQISLRVTKEEFTQGLNNNLDSAKQYSDTQKKALETDLSTLRGDLQETDEYINGAFRDGIVYDSEKIQIEGYLNTIKTSKSQYDNRYQSVHDNSYLPETPKLNLESAKTDYDTKYNMLVLAITNAIDDQLADDDETAKVNAAFDAYNQALALLTLSLEVAIDAISKAKAEEARKLAEGYADELKQGLDKDIANVQQSIKETDDYITHAFRDGLVSETEAKRIEGYLLGLAQNHQAIMERYTEIYENPMLAGTAKTDLYQKQTDYATAYDSLVTTINDATSDGQTTAEESNNVQLKFYDYNNRFKELTKAIETAIDFISTSKANKSEENSKDYTDGKVTPIETRLTTAESNITQNAKEISLRVKEETYNQGMQLVDGIDTRLKSAESTIVQHADAISQRVTIENFDTKAKQLQLDADNARKAADAAQQTADAAKSGVDDAVKSISDLTSDNKLSQSEKTEAKREWEAIKAEKITLEKQATDYGITTAKTNYIAAYNSLEAFLTPLIADLSTISDVDGETFRAKFKAYYDTRSTLLQAIASASKKQSDDLDTRLTNLKYVNANILAGSMFGEGDVLPIDSGTVVRVQPNDGDVNSLQVKQYSPSSAVYGFKTTRQTTEFKTGTVYTLSMQVAIGDVTKLDEIYIKSAEGGSQKLPSIPITWSDTAYRTVTLTFTSNISTSRGYIQVATADLSSTRIEYFYIKKLKIEEGGVATPYIPSGADTGTLGSQVAKAESEIKQNAEQIQLRVSKTDFNGKNVVSMINQTADEVLIEASKIKLNGDVNVGGFSNYVQDPDCEKALSLNWTVTSTGSGGFSYAVLPTNDVPPAGEPNFPPPTRYGIKLQVNEKKLYEMKQPKFDVEPGTPLAISCYTYKKLNETAIYSGWFAVNFYNARGSLLQDEFYVPLRGNDDEPLWSLVRAEMKVPATAAKAEVYIRFKPLADEEYPLTYYIGSPKVSKPGTMDVDSIYSYLVYSQRVTVNKTLDFGYRGNIKQQGYLAPYGDIKMQDGVLTSTKSDYKLHIGNGHISAVKYYDIDSDSLNPRMILDAVGLHAFSSGSNKNAMFSTDGNLEMYRDAAIVFKSSPSSMTFNKYGNLTPTTPSSASATASWNVGHVNGGNVIKAFFGSSGGSNNAYGIQLIPGGSGNGFEFVNLDSTNIGMKGPNQIIKFLGRSSTTQFRNRADSDYASITVGGLTNHSYRDSKTGIEKSTMNASDIIKNLIVREYYKGSDLVVKDECGNDLYCELPDSTVLLSPKKQIGLIWDEAADCIRNPDGIDLYKFCTLLLKALQETDERLTAGGL